MCVYVFLTDRYAFEKVKRSWEWNNGIERKIIGIDTTEERSGGSVGIARWYGTKVEYFQS